MQKSGKLVAERVDSSFEAVVEHVADHDHSALRPLPHAAEIGMIELRLASIPFGKRAEQGDRGVEADSMAFRRLADHAKPFGREVLHCRPAPGGRLRTSVLDEAAVSARDF